MEIAIYLILGLSLILNIFALIEVPRLKKHLKFKAFEKITHDGNVAELNSKIKNLEDSLAKALLDLKGAKEKPTADAKHLLKELLSGSALIQVEVIEKEHLFLRSPKGML